MRFSFFATLALLTFCASAQAECFKTLPKVRTGHWHYRYVNGDKCWFGPDAPRQQQQHAELGQRRPTPIEPLAVEEEWGPEPTAAPPTHAKIIYVSKPPSVSRRIAQTFEELVTRCQDDLNACTLPMDGGRD
jgi:hypothetical protein